MLAFVLVTLLVIAGTDEAKHQPCEGCIPQPNATAEAGLCFVVPCFMNVTGEVKSITWDKCGEECKQKILSTVKNEQVESQFKGRVSLLNKDLTKENCGFTIKNVTKDDSGSYQVTITTKRDSKQFTAKVNINVAELTEKPSLRVPPLVEGQSATLTCTAPRRHCEPSPRITWTWRAGGKDAVISGNVTKNENENQTSISTLTFKVSAEHNGTRVACRVSFSGGAATEEVEDLRLSTSPRISNSSKCTRHSGVLTCVCVAEGPPQPTIEWPHLRNNTRYSVLTTVWDQKVNSTATVSGEDVDISNLQCVTNNVLNKLEISDFQEEDVLSELLRTIKQLPVIVAFLVGLLLGIILTSVITCLARKCQRKRSLSLTDDVQMVGIQAVSAMDAGRSAEGEKTGDGGGERPMEVEYSDIDFSALKMKDAAEAVPATETEYAEIKKEVAEGEDAGEEEAGAALEGSEESNVMMGGEEGTPAEEEGGEEVALYSNVNEIMVEI